MKLSEGRDIIRKSDEKVIKFNRRTARLRCEAREDIYIVKEQTEAIWYAKKYQNNAEENNEK